MKKGIFLDRDGVLNVLVLNKVTGEYEPPHHVEDLKLFPYTIKCLKELQDSGYYLFLVSNQPDYAKGKATLESIKEVHLEFSKILSEGGVHFKEFYYCYHHPKGIVPDYSYDCECRKPKPFFLLKAAKDHGVDLKSSWMVGDRDSDTECGKAAGTKTILIDEPLSTGARGKSTPDYEAKNLEEAVAIILKEI